MSITQVTNADELETALTEGLTAFMEQDETFNVQGRWTGDDGLTISVIFDFGIESRDDETGYIGTISARHSANEEFRETHDMPFALQQSETYIQAAHAVYRALDAVFQVKRYNYVMSGHVHESDMDTHVDVPVQYTHWNTRDHIETPVTGAFESTRTS